MTEERWYVSFRGHTLGPLTPEQVRSSLRKKELGPDDCVASTADRRWVPLSQVKEFHSALDSLQRPEIPLPPPPRFLWQKKRKPPVPEPAAPQAQEAAPATAPLEPASKAKKKPS